MAAVAAWWRVVAAALLVAVVFNVIHRRQLDRDLTGVAIRTPDAFYGHHTVDFEKGGKLVGLLSANSHGGFIQSKDLRK